MASESSRKLEAAFGLAADVDEQLVLILGDDQAGEDLTFIEDFEALFVHALFERELVFFEFFRRRRCDVGSSNEISPLLSAPGRKVPGHTAALCAVPSYGGLYLRV